MSDRNREYAEALYALAMETNQEKPYLDALRLVQSVLDEETEFVTFLSAPSVPMDVRVAALEEVFGTTVAEHVLSFVQILCSHGRIGDLSDCIEEYHRLYQTAMAMSTAYVTSAVALTEEQKTRLVEKLATRFGRKVRLECTVDEHLLGGISVRLDDVVLDGSLRHRLQEVKDVIEQ